MRDIKFRAWDKQSKKMIYYDKDCSSPDMTLNGVLIKHQNQYDMESGLSSNVSYEYDLMQFTGLKDKNGKDLDWWESDLLRKGSDHPNAPIGIITYEERKAKWVIVSKSGGEFCGLAQAYINGWAKIGNKWENPELL